MTFPGRMEVSVTVMEGLLLPNGSHNRAEGNQFMNNTSLTPPLSIAHSIYFSVSQMAMDALLILRPPIEAPENLAIVHFLSGAIFA